MSQSNQRKQLTLCMVCEPERILLGMKKRGFGSGLWNGFGGKVEPGESIPAAAVRELQEEAGLTAHTCAPLGRLEFVYEGMSEIYVVTVFRVDEYTGTVQESEEMRPAWFSLTALPFSAMWPSDQAWFPYLLARQSFIGRVTFAPLENGRPIEVVSCTIEPVAAVAV